MVINVLCASTYPKGHTQSASSYSELAQSKAAFSVIITDEYKRQHSLQRPVEVL